MGNLPGPGMEPVSPELAGRGFNTRHQRNPVFFLLDVMLHAASGGVIQCSWEKPPPSLSGRDEMPSFQFQGKLCLEGPGSRPGKAGQRRSACRACRVLRASFSAILLNTGMHTNNTGIWVTCRCSGPVRVRCGLKFCIPNKLLGDADAPGSWKGNYWETQDLRGFLQGSKKVESWASLALASNDQIPSRSLTFCKIPWRRAWQPTPVFLLGNSHGQRSLEGYSPWGSQKSWTQPSN